MLQARTQNIARALIVSIVAAPIAVLAWMSAADRMAADSAQLRRSHFGGASAANAAFGYLAHKDPQAALRQARRAVRTAPVDPSSTSALATTELTMGRTQAAYGAFAIAGSLGWRDIPTQLFWLAQALSVGDIDVARDRLDALLRRDVDNDAVAAAIQELEQTPAGQRAFASLLAKNPPWESRVFIKTGDLADDAFAGRMAAIDIAASHGVKLNCAAIGFAANHLLREGRIDDAKELWRRACDRSGDVYLSDGSFEMDLAKASSSPFDWRLQNRGGLDTSVLPAPPPLQGRALRIESSMTVRTVAARQLAALRPGPYRITWQTTRDSDGKSDDSIDMLVRCNGTSLLDLVNTRLLQARPNAVTKTFSIPATDCAIQGIEIQKAASLGGESETGWIDNIQISPVG
jgi:hypothetical protein